MYLDLSRGPNGRSGVFSTYTIVRIVVVGEVDGMLVTLSSVSGLGGVKHGLPGLHFGLVGLAVGDVPIGVGDCVGCCGAVVGEVFIEVGDCVGCCVVIEG